MDRRHACWLDDQRMAFALGELSPERAEEVRAAARDPDVLVAPTTTWAREFVRALVAELTGLDAALPEDAAWSRLATEARAHVLAHPGHIQPPGKWLDEAGQGYFCKWDAL